MQLENYLFTRDLHKNTLTISRIIPKEEDPAGKFAPEKEKERKTAECSGLGQIFRRVKICIFLLFYVKTVITYSYNFGGWSVRINWIFATVPEPGYVYGSIGA